MSILNRYIILAWLRLLGICLGSFLSVYLVLDMMERIPRFLRSGGALLDMLSYFFFKLPEMVGQAAPFSILMATLLTLGLLSRNSEIIAMRSCGVSLLRISLPMLWLGLVASILLLINAELVVPMSSERMSKIEQIGIKKKSPHAVFKRNNIWFRSDNTILQAQLFDPQTKVLKGVTIWSLDTSMSPVSRTDADTAEFGDDHWILQKPVIKIFNTGPGLVTRSMPSVAVELNLKIDDLRILDKNADNMSFGTLKEYSENLQRSGYDAYRYLTMMHAKLSEPFAAFVMVVLGIPFALRNSRSGGVAVGIGSSIAIGFTYFVINAILLSYGRSDVLPPVVAAWGANLIFVMGGVWLALTVKN